jgi:cytochrome c biogenesis protein CcmG/thiol:disulfide interchange protein DsbE
MIKYLIPLVLFLGLVVFLAIGLNRDPREIPSPLINTPAPEFKLAHLEDPTKTLSATEMRGKVWLLNFWGSWCIACREEHPVLLKYSKGEVPIYGIAYKYANDDTDEHAGATAMLAEGGNPYTVVVYDPAARTSIDYGVYGAPESFLIDKQGVIRFKQIGPITDEVWNSKILPLARELNK